MMKAADFCTKALYIAQHCKSYYLWGTFGAPLTGELIVQKAKQYPAHYPDARRAKMAVCAAQGNYWAFDCIGLIKSILWGWNGDRGRAYGGATYAANGVPDLDANTAIERCSGVSTSFAGIVPGEVVWMRGHIGIYIGGGRVVEATAAWDSGVQVSACGNLGAITGLHTRTWVKHGKLPWVDYSTTKKTEDSEMVTKKTISIDGKPYTVQAIEKDGENYIRLRSLEVAGYGIRYDVASGTASLKAPQTRLVDAETQDMQTAIDKVQETVGLSGDTMDYLLRYKYGDALLIKLAAAMK